MTAQIIRFEPRGLRNFRARLQAALDGAPIEEIECPDDHLDRGVCHHCRAELHDPFAVHCDDCPEPS